MKREELIQALFETMDIAKRRMQVVMQGVMSGATISRPQLELLFTIKHLQPISPNQLAEKLRLTRGAISQMADALDRQQLISRQIDSDDRRRQTLQVSPQGLKLLRGLDKKRRAVMERVIQDLTDEELAIWLRIQRKLASEVTQINDYERITS